MPGNHAKIKRAKKEVPFDTSIVFGLLLESVLKIKHLL